MFSKLFNKQTRPVAQPAAPVAAKPEPIPLARTLKELKAQQKARAASIKLYRLEQKKAQRTKTSMQLPEGFWLLPGIFQYRLYHIAYCMERGTAYERIEPKVHEGNEPDWKQIDQIRALLQKEAADAAALCSMQT